jgi:hypothetical protein
MWKSAPGAELGYCAVVECCGGGAGEHETDVFDSASGEALRGSDVLGPSPARLTRRPTDGDASDVDDLESAVFVGSHLVGGLESLQDYVDGCQRAPLLGVGRGLVRTRSGRRRRRRGLVRSEEVIVHANRLAVGVGVSHAASTVRARLTSVAGHVIASSPRPCLWRGRIRRRRWPRVSTRTERPRREWDE